MTNQNSFSALKGLRNLSDNRLTLNVAMENHNFSFEDLRVYKAIRQLVKDVYVLVNKLPAVENFAFPS
jgi:hypothetical protein